MSRGLNQRGLDLIKRFEGLRLSPYLDVGGIPTIGYGTTMYSTGIRVTMKDKPIDEEYAEMLLEHDVESTCSRISKATESVKLNDNEFAALVCLAYNIGINMFLGSTLYKRLMVDRPRAVIANEFLRWNKVNGKVVQGLVNRRRAEYELFLSKE